MSKPAGGFTVMDQLDTIWRWYHAQRMNRADAVVQVLAHTNGLTGTDAGRLLDCSLPPSTPALGRGGVIA